MLCLKCISLQRNTETLTFNFTITNNYLLMDNFMEKGNYVHIGTFIVQTLRTSSLESVQVRVQYPGENNVVSNKFQRFFKSYRQWIKLEKIGLI